MGIEEIENNLEQLEEAVVHMNDSFKTLGQQLREMADPLVPKDVNNDGNVSSKEVQLKIARNQHDQAIRNENNAEIKKRNLSNAILFAKSPKQKNKLENALVKANNDLQKSSAEKSNAYHDVQAARHMVAVTEDLMNISTQQTRTNLNGGAEGSNDETAKEDPNKVNKDAEIAKAIQPNTQSLEEAAMLPLEMAFSGQVGQILDVMINNTEVDDPAVMDLAMKLNSSAMMRNLLFKFKREIAKEQPDKEMISYLKNKIRKEINNYKKTN